MGELDRFWGTVLVAGLAAAVYAVSGSLFLGVQSLREALYGPSPEKRRNRWISNSLMFGLTAAMQVVVFGLVTDEGNPPLARGIALAELVLASAWTVFLLFRLIRRRTRATAVRDLADG